MQRHLMPIVCVLLALLVEVFIFNLPFWLTLKAKPIQTVNENLGPGLVRTEDNKAKVSDPKQAWMDISTSDQIEYLYLNHDYGDQEHRSSSGATTLSWTTSTKKPTDSNWYPSTSTIMFSPENEMTRYSHIGGGVTDVRLMYNVNYNDIIKIPSFTANPHVPFRVSLPRAALEAVLVLSIICFRPDSPLYRRRFVSRDLVCWAGMICLLAIEMVTVVGFWLAAGGSNTPSGLNRLSNGLFFDNSQYNHMANALIHGHVDLDMPVNKDLAAMANPYDTGARVQVGVTTDDPTPILWDVAFKSGKYYCYFGVLPALFMFVPFKLVTGTDLSVGLAILMLALVNTVMSMMVAVQITRLFSKLSKHGLSSSLGAVMLVSCAIFMGLQIINLVPIGFFYQLPQTMALAFTLLGISCWIESKLSGLNKVWLALGSLAIAMTLGCRPQFTLAAMLAIPLFWEEIRELWIQGRLGGRGLAREVGIWSCALIPFLLVFAPLLAYNKVRFGSYLDFGASYNLTGYDMPNSSLPYTQLFPMAFLYFLQPPSISTSFPLMTTTPQFLPLWSPMQGSYGGYLTTIAPFAMVLFMIAKWRVQLGARRMKPFCWTLGIYALVVFFFDAHISGYDVRYLVDFGWALMLLFALVFLSIDGGRKETVYSSTVIVEKIHLLEDYTEFSRTMISIILAGMILGIILNFFSVFQLQSIHGTRLWWDVYSWFLFV